MRDWTRFLRHRIKKYPDSPMHTLTDSLRTYFFPLWRAYLFFYGFAVEFAVYVWTVAVSATKKLRIRKYPYTCGRGLTRQTNKPLRHVKENVRRNDIICTWRICPWRFFRGGQICNDERPSKNSKNVDFDCIMKAFFDERNKKTKCIEVAWQGPGQPARAGDWLIQLGRKNRLLGYWLAVHAVSKPLAASHN